MIGYEHIRVQSPYPLQHLEHVHIQWKTGEHGRIRLTGTSPDSEQVSAALQAAADDTLYVYAQQGEQELSLFKGLVQRVEVTHSQGIYTLIIEGVSASYALDVEKRKRTFPEEQQTYSALIGKVLQAYPGSDMIYHTGGGEAVGEPILQYEETDWELLQRLASRLQAVVVCDILEAVSPKLHFGMPEGASRELPQDVSYTARKNLKAYHLAGGLSSGLHDTDFFEYELTTLQRYALGEQVKFRNQPFVIRELRAELEQGELHFHYVLARPDGIRRETLRNPLLRGISLEGEVLAVRGEEVKLRLEIDKDDGLAEPHWYPFAPPTGSAMYCLPQVGTKASLYYPDATGSGALIVGTVRKNGGDCAKTGDTNTRYFGTEHGSELKLAPSHVNLQKDPEGAMLVSLNDETGIEITSPGKLTMTAELELELHTPQQIILGSESQILANRGESEAGLVVESEYHLLGETVWADGSDRTTYPPFDDEPELGEEPEPEPPFNWGKLVKNVLVGLAVVVAVAAVAALTVATLGAGPILIGAVASGALIGGAMGVGMMAVSDIARGEVSDMSDYALTGLKDSFIGAVSGAIFGPGAAVGTAFARKMGAAGAEGAFTSIMDQLLRGEKINWKTVAMDAGIGMLTLGALDNKYAKQLGGFIGKIGNKISPASIKSGISKGMDKAAAGYQKALEKLSDAGSALGKKMKELGKHAVDFGEALKKDLNILAGNAKDFAEEVQDGFKQFSNSLYNHRLATDRGLGIPQVNVSNSSRTPDLEITPERQRQIDALKNGEYSGTSGNKGTEGTGEVSSYDKKRSVEDIKKELTEDTSNRAREIFESGTSKKEMGPCLSGIHDPLTNKTFFGQNFKNNATMRQEYQKWIDNDADPIIKNLVKEYELKIASGEIKLSEVADTRLAAHSEIRALDQVLKARREANLPVNGSTISELFLHNIDLYKSDGVGNIVTKIRCENCRYLTDGINTVGHN